MHICMHIHALSKYGHAAHMQKIHKQWPIAVVVLIDVQSCSCNAESTRQVDVTPYTLPMFQSDLSQPKMASMIGFETVEDPTVL